MSKFNFKRTIGNLAQPKESLNQRVINSSFWLLLSRIINRSLSFIRIIIVARLLAPNDFGLMGIALLTMATVESFSETGLHTALIQKKENIKSHLDSAWTILILRGFTLFGILFLIAPYASIFFDTPEAKPIIQVIGFTVLLRAFSNISIVYFQKELEFNKQFVYQLSITLSEFIVVIFAALIFKNVWALVIGLLTGSFIGLIMSYKLHPYRPHLNFDLGKVKELFGFGKWIFGSSILVFLVSNGDDIFVGKLLGVTALGYYQLAYRISGMPATQITQVISQVTLPAYSKLQDNLPKLRKAYLKTFQLTAFLSFPISGLIFILASDFTMIFLGEKWIPIIPVMQALILWGLMQSIGAMIGTLWISVGKPKIVTFLQAGKLVILALLIYPFIMWWGILGAAIAVVVASFIPTLIAFYEVTKTIDYHIIKLSNLITIPLISTIIMIAIINSIKVFLLNQINLFLFFLFVLTGLAIYIFMIYLFEKFYNYELTKIFSTFNK
jgi:lipopolysaccharide exporter